MVDSAAFDRAFRVRLDGSDGGIFGWSQQEHSSVLLSSSARSSPWRAKMPLRCSARSKSTRATSEAIARVSVVAELAARFLYFGLLKRAGKVYAKIIPDAKGKTLKAIIEDKVVPDSVVYSDTFSSYNVLDVSRFKHYRINHSELFSDHKNHINGIENFWNQTKRHMRRFNGIPATHFHLSLKKCEWRFNTPQPKQQQTKLIQWATTHLR